MKSIRADSNFDAIQAYMRNDGGPELSKFQKDLLERWTTAHAQMLELIPDVEIAEVLKKRFDVALTTAYRDISNARKLFGEANALDKNHCLSLTWQMCIEELKEARREAPAEGDKRAKTKDTKLIASILKTMADIAKSLQESGQDLYKVFNFYNIQITGDPTDIGLDPVIEAEVTDLLNEIERDRGKRLG